MQNFSFYTLLSIKVSKNGSQLSGWKLYKRDCFCDFGRKLVNLSLAVHV